ncbi:MAG: hypothetical protein KBC50_01675 [Candidatus Pacebacteria bacterium]|nr:hypothetical protein [Candidatus Paceibacterota bacterium]
MPTLDRQEGYVVAHETLLTELKAMWTDPMVQLYHDAELPEHSKQKGSIFLAGPTSRNQVLHCQWRATAVAILRKRGFAGWIYCPEPRGFEILGDFTERSYIHQWESSRLVTPTTCADHAVFWIPRKADELLGLNTNLELGIFLGMKMQIGSVHWQPNSLFIGWPDGAERMGLPNHYMNEVNQTRYSDLESLCADLVASRNR